MKSPATQEELFRSQILYHAHSTQFPSAPSTSCPPNILEGSRSCNFCEPALFFDHTPRRRRAKKRPRCSLLGAWLLSSRSSIDIHTFVGSIRWTNQQRWRCGEFVREKSGGPCMSQRKISSAEPPNPLLVYHTSCSSHCTCWTTWK